MSHVVEDHEDRLMIDVAETIANNVWDLYCHTKSRLRTLFLKRKDHTIEVPMHYFHFQVISEEMAPLANDRDVGHAARELPHPPTVLERRTQRTDTAPKAVGMKTDFRNRTGTEQTFSLKFEKTRKSSATVNIHRGFSFGEKTSFTLGLPKILPDGKLGAEIDRRVSVTKAKGDTFEQTFTTCATSDIKVAPNSHYTATMIWEERNLQADFKARVRMTMPKRQARVFVKNTAGETIFEMRVTNLADLFSQRSHVLDEDGQARSDALDFDIEGRVDYSQLSDCRIDVAPNGGQNDAAAGGGDGGAEDAQA